MIVIVIGAGTIGGSLAEVLLQAGYDVIVIDIEKHPLDRLENFLDVQTIQGHGCDPAILEMAKVSEAELVLSMTNDEELNLLATTVAKRLGAKRAVARVRSAHYLKMDQFDFRKALGIDLTISPEVLTAAEVIKYLDNPDAMALNFYAQGKVQLLQFELEAGHAFVGSRLKELKLPGGVLIVLVTRGAQVLIPNGEVQLLEGDKVTLLGKSGTMSGMKQIPSGWAGRVSNVVIAGGGDTGHLLAASLEQKVANLKLLEIQEERCHQLGGMLTRTNVLHGDATDRRCLHDERVGRADVFIAAMKNDEDNIMASLLAKKLGAAKCVAVVKRSDYTPILQENTSIDLALSPRQVTAERILALVRRGMIHNISLLEDGQAEVIELTPAPTSPLLDKPLMELQFPAGSLVGMINRGNVIKIPRGSDQIRLGDTVIMVTLAEVAHKVEELFQ